MILSHGWKTISIVFRKVVPAGDIGGLAPREDGQASGLGRTEPLRFKSGLIQLRSKYIKISCDKNDFVALVIDK